MTPLLTVTQHTSSLGKFFRLGNTARLLAVLAVASLIATQVYAAQRVWDGGGDNTNWFDADNWTGNAVPGSSDAADLTLGIATPPTLVVYDGSSTSIQSLTSIYPISLNSSTLTVTNAPVQTNSGLTLNGGSITAANGFQFLGSNALADAGLQPHLELLDGEISGDLSLEYSILTIGDTWTNGGGNTLEVLMRGNRGQFNGKLATNHVLAIQGTPESDKSWGEVFWKSGFENNGTIVMTTSGVNPNGSVMILDNGGHLTNNNLINVLAGTGSLRLISGTNRLTNAVGGQINIEAGTFLTVSGINEGSTNSPNWNHLTYEAAGGTISDRAYLAHAEVDISAASGTAQKLNLVGFDNRLISDNLANYTLNVLGTAIIPDGTPNVSQLAGEEADSHSVLTLYNAAAPNTAKTFTNSGKIILDAQHVSAASSAFLVGSANLDIGQDAAHTFVNAAHGDPNDAGIEVKTGTQNPVAGSAVLQPSFRQIRGIGTFRNEGLVSIDADTYLIIEGINTGTVQNPVWDRITYDAAGGRISGDAYLSHAEVMTSGTPTTPQTINLVGFDNRLVGDVADGYSLRVLGSQVSNEDPNDPEPDAFAHAVLTLASPEGAPTPVTTFTNAGKIILDSADIDTRTPRDPANPTVIATSNLEVGTNRLVNTGDIEVKLGSGSLRAIRGKTDGPDQGVLENATGGTIQVENGATLFISGTNINEGISTTPDWQPVKYVGSGGSVSGQVVVMRADLEFTGAGPSTESVLNLVTFDNRLMGTTISANNTLRILGTEIVPDPPAQEPADAFGHAVLTLTSSDLTNAGKIVLDSEDLDPSALGVKGVATATLDLGLNTMVNEGSIEAKLGTGSLRTVRGTRTQFGSDQGVLQNTGQIMVEAGAQLVISGTNVNEGGTPDWRPLKYIGAGGTLTSTEAGTGGDVLFMHTDIEFTNDTPASESVLNLVTFDNRLFGSAIGTNNTLRILGTELIPSSGPEPADAFGHAVLTVESSSVTNNGKIIFDSEDLDPAALNANGVGTANLDLGINTFINAGEILVRHTTGSLRELRGKSAGEFRHEGVITVEDGALFKIVGIDINAGVGPPSFSRVKFVANGGSTVGQVVLAHSDIHIDAAPTTGDLILNIATFDNVLRTDNPNGSTLRVVGTDLAPDAVSGDPELADQMGSGVLNLLNASGTTINHGKLVMTSMDIDPAFTRGIGASLIEIGLSTNIQNQVHDPNYIFINESDGVIEVEPGPVTDSPVTGARSARILQGKGTFTNRGLIDVKADAILKISGINLSPGNWAPLTYVAEGAGTMTGNAFLTHTQAGVGAAVTGGGQRVTNFATPDNVVTSDNPVDSTLRIVGTELIADTPSPQEPVDALGHAELFFMQQDTVNTGNIVLDAQDLDPASNLTAVGSSNLNLDLQGDQGNGQARTFTNEGEIEVLAGTINGLGPSLREIRGSGQLINRGMIKVTDPGDTGLYLTVSGINVGQQGSPDWKPIQFHVEDGGTTSGDVVLVHSQISVANNLASPSTLKLVGNDNTLMTDNNANSTLIVQGAGKDVFVQGSPNAFSNAALTFDGALSEVRNFGTIVLTDGHVGSPLSGGTGNAAINLEQNHDFVNEATGVIQTEAGTSETGRLILGDTTTSLVNKGQIIAPSQTDQFLFVEVSTTSEGGSFSGNIDFDSDLALDSGSSVQLQIGGATAQSGYDQVNVTANVTLGGDLDLVIASGFTPDYGDTFDVVSVGAGTRTGTFDQVSGAVISPDRALAVIYDFGGSPGVTLFTTLPGDFNLDLAVNIFDFGFLAAGFNQAGTWVDGDINGDGDVNIFDFGAFAVNFNQSVGGQGGAPLTAPEIFELGAQLGLSASDLSGIGVPEPGALSMVVVTMLMYVPRRRR